MAVVENNPSMERLLATLKPPQPSELDPGLSKYTAGGLVIEPDGAIVAAAARQGLYINRASLQDRVGYEAFVNKIHLDYWASDALAGQTLGEKLGQAIRLADAVGDAAVEKGARITVIIGVEVDRQTINFRFHGQHADEPPWLGELDGFKEPVMVRYYPSPAKL